jgi:hypothetical protein
MDSITQLAVLAAATVIAAGSAFAMAWALLHGAFRLMQPAAVRTVGASQGKQGRSVGVELVRGSRAAARHFVLHR